MNLLCHLLWFPAHFRSLLDHPCSCTTSSVATGCQSDALRSVVADKTIDQSLTDARGPSDWVWLLCTCTKQRRRRVFARRLTPSATRRRNAPTVARWRHRMTSLPPRRARASCRRRHMAPRTRARRAAWGKQVSKNVPIRTRDIRRGERNNVSATCSRGFKWQLYYTRFQLRHGLTIAYVT